MQTPSRIPRAAVVEQLKELATALATSAAALRDAMADPDDPAIKYVERLLAHAERLHDLLGRMSSD